MLMKTCGVLILITWSIESRGEVGNESHTFGWRHYSWSTSNALARSNLLDRQEILRRNCNAFMRQKKLKKSDNPEAFHNLLVDEEHKFLYCYVPKVACTNWKRVLMIVTGKWKGNRPLEIPSYLAHSSTSFQRLSNYSMLEIESKLATYDKLIVVRHPLERLLSAYRNKFEAKPGKKSDYFSSRFGRKIIKKYRSNPSVQSLKLGNDVTFREFVDFITDDNENGTRNEHWKPITDLCHPCIVNYNIVSRYESLVEDAAEILERLDSVTVVFPERQLNVKPTSRQMDMYFSILSLKQLKKLYNLYRLDLRLFDYTLETVLGFSLK